MRELIDKQEATQALLANVKDTSELPRDKILAADICNTGYEIAVKIIDSLPTVKAGTDSEAPVVENPNWKELDSYNKDTDDMVQVLCRVLPTTTSNSKVDSLKLRHHISIGEQEIGDLFVSIGFFGYDKEWYVVGWEPSRGGFTDARFYEVLAWQPLASIPTQKESKNDQI